MVNAAILERTTPFLGDGAAVLAVHDVTKAFLGTKALSGVSFSVAAGEIRALLGENGAGKSTLMKVLCGVHRPDGGSIILNGVERRFSSYKDAVEAGVGIAFQEFSLVPDLDAVENIFLGREVRKAARLLDRATMRRRAQAIFVRLGVDVPLSRKIRELSVAQQQFVEIAKALALGAGLLILDEPTATLTPAEVEHLFRVMRELKRAGVAIIFISHHMEEVFEICDSVTVLRDGAWVGDRKVAETDTDELISMMVGRRLESGYPARIAIPDDAPIALDVEALQIEADGPVNSFAVRRGEILGFAGLVGSGRTEAAMATIGATRVYRKTVWVNGRAAKLTDPATALAHGIGLLPESRKTEGLITPFSVQDNITINNLGKHRRFGPLLGIASQRATAQQLMGQLRIKAAGAEVATETLSGGNQQKVVIARWLDQGADILFFDEPTRGIDVGAKAEIYEMMRALAARGVSIVMISSELPEVIGMSDRVAVFRRGAIVRILEGVEVTQENVMRHAAAGDS